MAIIKDIQAREISDSRGDPTVEVDLWPDDGQMVRAAVPSGASTGKKEALELRDHDAKRFNGLGVLHAVANVNGPLRAFVLGQDPINQPNFAIGLFRIDRSSQETSAECNLFHKKSRPAHVISQDMASCGDYILKSISLFTFIFINFQDNVKMAKTHEDMSLRIDLQFTLRSNTIPKIKPVH